MSRGLHLGLADGDAAASCFSKLERNDRCIEAAHRTTGVEHPFSWRCRTRNSCIRSMRKTVGGAESEQVAAYELVGRKLAAKNCSIRSQPVESGVYMNIDATGRKVVVANYSERQSSQACASARMAPCGERDVLAHGGARHPDGRRATRTLHFVQFPTIRLCLSRSGTDQFYSYRLGRSTASYHPINAFAGTPPGAGRRHLTFHPTEKKYTSSTS